LTDIAGPPVIISKNGRHSVFLLKRVRDTFEARVGKKAFEELRQAELYPKVVWYEGFHAPEQSPDGIVRWSGKKSKVLLTNTGDRSRRVRFTMAPITKSATKHNLILNYRDTKYTLPVDDKYREAGYEFELPPKSKLPLTFELQGPVAFTVEYNGSVYFGIVNGRFDDAVPGGK